MTRTERYVNVFGLIMWTLLAIDASIKFKSLGAVFSITVLILSGIFIPFFIWRLSKPID